MAKRKNRVGRKRKSGERYNCGKLKPQDRADDLALSVRQKHLGITRTAARNRENGISYGVALMRREISQDQFAALETYDINRNDYLAAISFNRQRSASDFSGPKGFDGSEGDDPGYVEWCDRVIEKHKAIRHAVLSCGEPMAQMALQTWVDDNHMAWRQLGELRMAANAIHRVLNPKG